MVNSRNGMRIDFGSAAIKAEPFRPQKKDTLCRRCVFRYLMPGKKVRLKFKTFINSQRQTKISDQTIERVDGKPIHYIIHCIMCENTGPNGIHKGPTKPADWYLPAADQTWFNPMYFEARGAVHHNQIGNKFKYSHSLSSTIIINNN